MRPTHEDFLANNPVQKHYELMHFEDADGWHVAWYATDGRNEWGRASRIVCRDAEELQIEMGFMHVEAFEYVQTLLDMGFQPRQRTVKGTGH